LEGESERRGDEKFVEIGFSKKFEIFFQLPDLVLLCKNLLPGR
jgi:hypothetical protein